MIDYDEILNKWSDKVFGEVDRVNIEIIPKTDDSKTYRIGWLNGYVQGLLMATSFLSLIEKKEKRKPTPCEHGFGEWGECPVCGH